MFSNIDLQTVILSGKFILTRNFTATLDKKTWIVPKGFTLSFNIIPRIFWPLASHNDKDMFYASVLHEYLYSHLCKYEVSRYEADKILLQAMNELGASVPKKVLVFAIVRLTGWIKFRKKA